MTISAALNTPRLPKPCLRCGTLIDPSNPNYRKMKYCSLPCFKETQKKTDEQVFAEKVNKTETCWLWTGFLNHDGYGRVGQKRGVRTGGRAHRIAWEMVNGPVPKGMCVMHICDVRACVRPDHLKLGTHAENMADCKAKKRHVFGEDNFHAKLTEDQVREIRMLKGTASSYKVAQKYGVTYGAIASIWAGRSWQHVT